MQFNRKADGSLENLPAKHIDTGMGFERLCMALQHKESNYDTDVFTPLIAKVEELSGKNIQDFNGRKRYRNPCGCRSHQSSSFALRTDSYLPMVVQVTLSEEY
jgi:alanyl-tRNA synthetase